MNDDARLATRLRLLGDDPTPEFRAALRERLVDETTGRTIVPIDIGSPGTRRRDRRPGWLVVGTVAAAAALIVAGLVVVTRRGDPSPADDPEVTSDEFRAPTPDDLTGHLWIDPDLGLVRVPMLSFAATDADGAYAVEQFDGCNEGSGTVTLDGGDVVAAEIASTRIGCALDQPTRLAPGAVVGVDTDDLGRLRLLVADGGVATSYVALDSVPVAGTAADLRNTWWHPGTGAMAFIPTGRADAGGLAVAIGQCDTSGTINDGYLTTSEPIDATCAVAPEADADLVGRLADGTSRWYRYGTFLLMESDRGVDLFDISSTPVNPPDDSSSGDEAVAAFVDAVTGRTFVLLPDDRNLATDRPYITFPDPIDPELAVEGFSGCTSFFGRGSWSDAGDGSVTLDGGISVGTAGCSPGDDLAVVTSTVRFVASGDGLDVIGDDSTWSFVAVDGLPIPSLEQLEGRWSTLDEGELAVDPSQSMLSLGRCRTTFTIDVASLATDGWTGTECAGSELSLMRALETSDTQPSFNQVHLVGDVLLIESQSATRRPIVFALPYAGPLLDPTTVSIELGSAFGYRPADEVTADEIEAHVSSLLGPTTHDTGWFVTPDDPTITDHEDCMGGNTTRVLWWHDLSVVVWRQPDGTERLFAWSIGDIRATRGGDRREPFVAAPTDRSDVESVGAFPIGVGTAAGDVLEAYPDASPSTGPTFDDGARTWQVGRVTLVVLDDTVVGIGNEVSFC